MIEEYPNPDDLAAFGADLTVIGGGPVGLITALAAQEAGARVLLLESGGRRQSSGAQSQSDETILTPQTHHPGRITTARRLGGAGHLWGGRCVPFDRIDFQARPWLPGCGEPWPVNEADLAPYMARALCYLGAGEDRFLAPLADGLSRRLGQGGPFAADRLERWTADPRIDRRYEKVLSQSSNLLVALKSTVTSADHTDGTLTALQVWHEQKGQHHTLPVRQVVLAAGGLLSTKLLLNLQLEDPDLFGGKDGPLGRTYMGHLNGQIADIIFEDPEFHEEFDFVLEDGAAYTRRRIVPSDATQSSEHLSNIAFWPVVPEISQAEHRSGPLSAIYLGLSAPFFGPRFIAEAIRLKHLGPPPYRRAQHIRNLLTDVQGVLRFLPGFLWRRFASKPRVPGFFLRNPARRYGLEFHAEHLPHAESRIELDLERLDRTGMPHAKVDFRFDQTDAEPIIRAHTLLDAWLRENRLGHLVYRYSEEVPGRGVFEEAKHGNHQVGTMRMGSDASSAVTDGWGTTFSLRNLHVASTGILPTSSQANPTLTAVQLALRLVSRLELEGWRK